MEPVRIDCNLALDGQISSSAVFSKCLPLVAVMVLNYNGQRHLFECFSSLRNQTFANYEVYLIDNCSSDNSIEYTKQYFPWVKVISFKENFGFAKGYNKALAEINSELAVFLNNDTKVDKDWLYELVKGISIDSSVAIAGSTICLYDHPDFLQSAGGKISFIGTGIELHFLEKISKSIARNKYVGYVSGGSMIVKRDIFMRIGGFDEDYFAYDEDSDLCLRAWLMGFKVLYVPQSIVYHKIGSSFNKFRIKMEFLSEKNRLQSMAKNFQNNILLKGLLLSILYSTLKSFRFIYSREPALVLATFHAYYWVFKNLPKIMKKRVNIQAKRTLNDGALIKEGIIAPLQDTISALYNYRKWKNVDDLP